MTMAEGYEQFPIMGPADDCKSPTVRECEVEFDKLISRLERLAGVSRWRNAGLALAWTAVRVHNPRVYNRTGMRLEAFFAEVPAHAGLREPVARLKSSWETWLKCPSHAAHLAFEEATRALDDAQRAIRQEVVRVYGDDITVFFALAGEISRARYPMIYSEACDHFGHFGQRLRSKARQRKGDPQLSEAIAAMIRVWEDWTRVVADDN
jgi:hypothetical protein